VPPPDGRSVRCVEDPKRVFRWTDNQLRHYPSGKIASSWDPEWRDVVSLQCTGLDIASPMSLNYGDLPPSNRRPKARNNDPDPSWTNHIETMGDQIEEVQGDMYDQIEEVQDDMYDTISKVTSDLYEHLSKFEDAMSKQYDEFSKNLSPTMSHVYKVIHENHEEIKKRIVQQEKHINLVEEDVIAKGKNDYFDLQRKNEDLEKKTTIMAKTIDMLEERIVVLEAMFPMGS
jgi:gas vesicle protein